MAWGTISSKSPGGTSFQNLYDQALKRIEALKAELAWGEKSQEDLRQRLNRVQELHDSAIKVGEQRRKEIGELKTYIHCVVSEKDRRIMEVETELAKYRLKWQIHQQEIFDNKKRRGWNVTDIGSEIIHLAEELGELARSYRDKNDAEINDAIADMSIYLIGLCAIRKLDWEGLVEGVIIANQTRDHRSPGVKAALVPGREE